MVLIIDHIDFVSVTDVKNFDPAAFWGRIYC